MKKKHREITVDGKIYGWTVSDIDSEGDNELKIWFDKKVVYETSIPCFILITPSMVKKKIVNIGL